jgi:hypothetical protein
MQDLDTPVRRDGGASAAVSDMPASQVEAMVTRSRALAARLASSQGGGDDGIGAKGGAKPNAGGGGTVSVGFLDFSEAMGERSRPACVARECADRRARAAAARADGRARTDVRGKK